jgi:hypothetical protein
MGVMGVIRGVRLAVLTALALAVLASGSAVAAGPLTWSGPTLIDQQPPFQYGNTMRGISCPTTTLCVAVDDVGNIVTTNKPLGQDIDWSFERASAVGLSSVSCPTATLCVAVGSGEVLSATNPTGGAAAWKTTSVDSGHYLRAISCPTTTLCMAIDDNGNALSTTNPTAGAWTVVHVDDPVRNRRRARQSCHFDQPDGCGIRVEDDDRRRQPPHHRHGVRVGVAVRSR